MGLFNVIASGSFLPWRRSNRETDYEIILSRLATEITQVQSRVTQIRTRERRANVTLTLQAFLIWAFYCLICWYMGALRLPSSFHGGDDRGFQTVSPGKRLFLVWIPVAGSPFLILSTRRFVRWWYKRIGAAEEKHLVDLCRQQRDKIDEIKQATKYDRLRLLLEKYDETQPKRIAPPGSGQPRPKQTQPGQQQQQQQQKSQQKQQYGSLAAAHLQTPQSLPSDPSLTPAQRMAIMRKQAPGPASKAMVEAPISSAEGFQSSPLPTSKTWMDKLADAVLGSDPSAAGPEQKYALICSRCLSHNGLALREEFEEIQYICPHCGQFNSRRPSTAPISSPFVSRISSHFNKGGISRSVSSPGLAPSSSDSFLTPSKPSLRIESPSSGQIHSLPNNDKEQDEDEDQDEDAPPAVPLDQDESVTETSIDTPSKITGKASGTLRVRRVVTKEDSMDVDE